MSETTSALGSPRPFLEAEYQVVRITDTITLRIQIYVTNLLDPPLQWTREKEIFVFARPDLSTNHLRRAKDTLRLFSQVNSTHGGHIVDVVIAA